ncbi:MAG: aminoacyl-histidine dipeptidase [Prevotellaceae bacterium]|jgi:dipeptidase D|nr:aminoacyl-histidine dipeptidase [Prevotellaceae bacterium]
MLKNLDPAGVFHYFGEISCIPRPSKHEEKIIAYLMDFAAQQGLEAKCDKVGNVLIRKPASPKMEDRPTVVLQSHMDMVGEKNSRSTHRFDTDPIALYVEGEWIKAMDTTLGADCGIGIAAQLALLAGKELTHGPIECLFTVDEETGLTGADALEPGFLQGKILLNLDSEDEGELFIGCAGGTGVVGAFDIEEELVPQNHRVYHYTVGGLTGGHSGDDIHRGRANAVKVATRFLWQAQQHCQIRLHSFTGGHLRNAIAREASAILTVNTTQATSLTQLFEQHVKDIKGEYAKTDPHIVQTLQPVARKAGEAPLTVWEKTGQQRLLHTLYACPHGVMAMSSAMKGLVETSTNLSAVKVNDDAQIVVETSQRSALESAKFNVARMVDALFQLAGADIEHVDGYPGWEPNLDSPVLEIAKASYKRLFRVEPKVKAIHAGLECGLFLKKYPDLDMISFGPTIKNAHSPDERLNILSVKKFWLLLLDILQNV